MKVERHLFAAMAVVCLVGSTALAGKTIYVDDVTDPAEDGSEEHPSLTPPRLVLKPLISEETARLVLEASIVSR